MTIQISHNETVKATPENVWALWSDMSTWSEWDHGIDWCRLKAGHKFQKNGEASLKPTGTPLPLDIRIIECTPNKSFTDEGKFDLGTIQFFHEVIPQKEGVKITHTLTYTPKNPAVAEIFNKQMLPKLKKELPESVKTLAKMAKELSTKKVAPALK